MKATLSKFIEAISLIADAHKVQFEDCRDDDQIIIYGNSVPLFSDIKMAAQSFYRPDFVEITNHELYCHAITIWLYDDGGTVPVDGEPSVFLPEVNELKLSMALPRGWIHKLKD